MPTGRAACTSRCRTRSRLRSRRSSCSTRCGSSAMGCDGAPAAPAGIAAVTASCASCTCSKTAVSRSSASVVRTHLEASGAARRARQDATSSTGSPCRPRSRSTSPPATSSRSRRRAAAGGEARLAAMTGRVEGIYVISEHGELPEPVDSVRALAGRGLKGNRYFFEDAPAGTALTLIAAEAVEAMEREHGIALEPRETRRNVVTRGIDVNELVGKRFRVGDVECRGVELCEPCADLQAMTKPGVIKGLAHRGGLNADILTDGEISVGDAVGAEA